MPNTKKSAPKGLKLVQEYGNSPPPATKRSLNPKIYEPDYYKKGPGGKVPGYYGLKAIPILEERLGRRLTNKEKRIVTEEGLVDGEYYDSKNIITYGVGQTGEYIKAGFEASVKEHEDRTRAMIPDYDILPEYLQSELLQSMYRGDLGDSPTARRLFNQGRYEEAADEFLNHDEYKDRKTPDHIKARILSVSKAMRKYGRE